MITRLAHALLPVGCFLGIGSLLCVIGTRPGTAERIVAVLALIIAVVLVGGTVVLLRRSLRLEPEPSDLDLGKLRGVESSTKMTTKKEKE